MRVKVTTYVDLNVGDVVRYDDEENYDFIGYITRVGNEFSNILWSDGATIEWPNTSIFRRLTGDNKYDIFKQLLVNAESED